MFRLFRALRQAEVDAKKQEIQEHRQAEQEAKASNSQSVAKLKAWQGLESWETFFETEILKLREREAPGCIPQGISMN